MPSVIRRRSPVMPDRLAWAVWTVIGASTAWAVLTLMFSL